MAKNESILGGVLTTLNALALIDSHTNRRRKPTRKTTYTIREVYDAKTGRIITLRSANTVITEEI